MAADVSKIADSLGRETLSAKLDRMREEIAIELRSTGSFTIQEGGRTFTVRAPRDSSNQSEGTRK